MVDRRAVPGLVTGTAGLVCSLAALINGCRTTARLRSDAQARSGGITDAETGLFSEAFFLASLDKRVSAARRSLRPLAVVLLEVVDGATPAAPRTLAGSLVETLRDADTTCRLADGRFAVVLEDTNETGAVWTIERVRRRLVQDDAGLTLWAGVACYPAHAFDADHILAQSRRTLEAAKDWNQHRIEVATVPDD